MSQQSALTRLLTAGLVLAVARPASGQQVAIDLATAKDQSAAKVPDTTRVPPGTYRIRAYNVVPKYRYTITVTQLPIAIQPLSLPSSNAKIAEEEQRCGDLSKAIKTLLQDDTESQVPDHIASLVTAWAKDTTDCTVTRDTARRLIEHDTVWYASPSSPGKRDTVDKVVSLAAGNFIVVTVNRTDSAGRGARTWQHVYSTGPKGEWRLTYGLGVPVLAKIWGWFPTSFSYYAKQVGTGTNFVITRNRVTSHLGAVTPALFYTFMPSTEPTWSPSPVAGLGFDLTSPVVFLGYALTYHSNIQASVGMTLHQEAVLLGRYNEGDIVTSDLTADQLTEKVYRLRPYFALTFRFSSNPFGSGTNTSGKQPQPKDAKQPQPTGAKSSPVTTKSDTTKT